MIENTSFKLFIEGEEFPFLSGSVSLSANRPSSATFNIPSSMKAPDVPQYSMVHLFYLDPFDHEWRFMWEGVTIGHGYNKTSDGAQFTISCVDYFIYLAVSKIAFLSHSFLPIENKVWVQQSWVWNKIQVGHANFSK